MVKGQVWKEVSTKSNEEEHHREHRGSFSRGKGKDYGGGGGWKGDYGGWKGDYGGWKGDGGRKGGGKSKDHGKEHGGKDHGGKGVGKVPREPKEGEEERKFVVETKPYAEALQELFNGKVVRPSDFDAKVIQVMDWLHEAGKSESAINVMVKSLEGVPREKVVSWPQYLYALLRKFDKEVYEKGRAERGRPERSRKDRTAKPSVVTTVLRVGAPEFVPGAMWAGLPGTKEDGKGVIFEVECKTSDGESVFVGGSSQELGKWEPKDAKPLTHDGDKNIWRSQLEVGTDVEYKFLIKKGGEARWEEIKENRKCKGTETEKLVSKFGE